jgi:hypothetical protein
VIRDFYWRGPMKRMFEKKVRRHTVYGIVLHYIHVCSLHPLLRYFKH